MNRHIRIIEQNVSRSLMKKEVYEASTRIYSVVKRRKKMRKGHLLESDIKAHVYKILFFIHRCVLKFYLSKKIWEIRVVAILRSFYYIFSPIITSEKCSQIHISSSQKGNFIAQLNRLLVISAQILNIIKLYLHWVSSISLISIFRKIKPVDYSVVCCLCNLIWNNNKQKIKKKKNINNNNFLCEEKENLKECW